MNGRRIIGKSPHELELGDYGRWAADENHWYARTPNGLLANLSNHTVQEHEDGTVTVSPSIFVNQGKPESWHGFLERGIWRTSQ